MAQFTPQIQGWILASEGGYIDEVWRPIPEYAGYEASSCGRIRSLKRNGIKVLRQRLDRGGYLRVTVCREGIMANPGVHRLVCAAFHGAPPDISMHAAHGDGVRHDNRPSNIRWATAKSNQADRKIHKTDPSLERNPRSILTEDAVRDLRRRYVRGSGRGSPGNIQSLADEYGVSTQVARLAATGRTWRSMSAEGFQK